MAEYKYKGETFLVEKANDCEVRVTDGEFVVAITKDTQIGGVYAVTLQGGGWRKAHTPEQAFEVAGDYLVRAREARRNEPGDPCKALSEFVEKL